MNVGEDYEHVSSSNVNADRRHPSNEPAACAQDIDRLATDLRCWREILVNGDRVLNWENPKLLGIIQLVFTLVFFFVWVIGPSLLTSIALIGLLVNAIDFAVPVLAPKYFDHATWTSLEEDHFRQICSRLGNIRYTAVDTITWLRSLRHDRPTFYFTIMTVFYFVMAIVAERINGLLLGYLLLTVAFISPGMIRHSVFSHLRNQVMKVVNDKMGKKTK